MVLNFLMNHVENPMSDSVNQVPIQIIEVEHVLATYLPLGRMDLIAPALQR